MAGRSDGDEGRFLAISDRVTLGQPVANSRRPGCLRPPTPRHLWLNLATGRVSHAWPPITAS